MLGATVYDLYKNRAIPTVEGEELIAIGFAVAFVCALFVVRTLVGFVSRRGSGVFAWYRIAIGSVAMLFLVMSRRDPHPPSPLCRTAGAVRKKSAYLRLGRA